MSFELDSDTQDFILGLLEAFIGPVLESLFETLLEYFLALIHLMLGFVGNLFGLLINLLKDSINPMQASAESLNRLSSAICRDLIHLMLAFTGRLYGFLVYFCRSPIHVMQIFAESFQRVLEDLYLQIRSHTPLNIICFYAIVFFFVAYVFLPGKNKMNVIYVHKNIDTNAQMAIKEKVKNKIKKITILAEKIRAKQEGEKTHDFSNKLDQAILEIRSIKDLHNEFRQEMTDSHHQIIETLAPNKKHLISIECSYACNVKNTHNQIGEKKDDKHLVEKIVKFEEYLSPPTNHFGFHNGVRENKPSAPEIHQCNQFRLPKKIPRLTKLLPLSNKVNSRGIPTARNSKIIEKDAAIKKHAENTDNIHNIDGTHEKKNKKEVNDIESPGETVKLAAEKKEIPNGKEIAKVMDPVKLPSKVIIPRPPPIIAPKVTPIRVKGVKPLEDRSKYAPSPTIKSSPFG